MAPSSKKSSKPKLEQQKPGARSQAELARRAGVRRQAVTAALRAPDCPIPRKGPWTEDQVKQYLAWRETKLTPTRGPEPAAGAAGVITQDAVRGVDARLKLERMMKLRLEREILAGDHVPRVDVERGWADRVRYFRESLERWSDELAAPLAVLTDPREVRIFLRDHVNALIDEYARRPYPGAHERAG